MSSDFVTICDNLTFIVLLSIGIILWSSSKQSRDSINQRHMDVKSDALEDITSGSILSMKLRLIELERLIESTSKDMQELRSYTGMLNQFTRAEVQAVHSRLNKGGDIKREMERIKATINALWQFSYRVSISSPAGISEDFSLEKQLLPLSKGSAAHSDRYRDPAPICVVGVQQKPPQHEANKLHESKCILTAGNRRFDLGTEEGRSQWNKYLSFRKKAGNSDENTCQKPSSSSGQEVSQKVKQDQNGDPVHIHEDSRSNVGNLRTQEKSCKEGDLPYVGESASLDQALKKQTPPCAYSSSCSSQGLGSSELLSDAEDSGGNDIEINTAPTTSVSSDGAMVFSSNEANSKSKKPQTDTRRPPQPPPPHSAKSTLSTNSSRTLLSSSSSPRSAVRLHDKWRNQNHTSSASPSISTSSPRSSIPVRKLHQRGRPNSVI